MHREIAALRHFIVFALLSCFPFLFHFQSLFAFFDKSKTQTEVMLLCKNVIAIVTVY